MSGGRHKTRDNEYARASIVRLRRPVGLFGFSAILLVSLVGCDAATSGREAGTEQDVVHRSRIKLYGSVEEITADSTAVAVATASDVHRVDKVGDVPFTVTTVAINQLVNGDLPTSTIELRQVGTAGVTSSQRGEEPILVPGQRYLLFVQPFEFQPGEPTGQYVVTGDLAGLYLEAGDQFVALADQGDNLPREIPKDAFLAQVATSQTAPTDGDA